MINKVCMYAGVRQGLLYVRTDCRHTTGMNVPISEFIFSRGGDD